jgi:starch synthase
MPSLTPTNDTTIARRYSVGTLDQKVQNKTALQEEFGWPAEPKRAMLGFPVGMSEALGGKLLHELLPGLLSLPIEIVILGKGSADYGALFTKLSHDQHHRVRILPESSDNVRKMLAACDMALFLHDPKTSKELLECLHYGVVPIAPKTSALEDYDPIQEAGDAFLYEQATVWHCYGALVRALETFKFPFDWRTIQRHCMETAQK